MAGDSLRFGVVATTNHAMIQNRIGLANMTLDFASGNFSLEGPRTLTASAINISPGEASISRAVTR